MIKPIWTAPKTGETIYIVGSNYFCPARWDKYAKMWIGQRAINGSMSNPCHPRWYASAEEYLVTYSPSENMRRLPPEVARNYPIKPEELWHNV